MLELISFPCIPSHKDSMTRETKFFERARFCNVHIICLCWLPFHMLKLLSCLTEFAKRTRGMLNFDRVAGVFCSFYLKRFCVLLMTILCTFMFFSSYMLKLISFPSIPSQKESMTRETKFFERARFCNVHIICLYWLPCHMPKLLSCLTEFAKRTRGMLNFDRVAGVFCSFYHKRFCFLLMTILCTFMFFSFMIRFHSRVFIHIKIHWRGRQSSSNVAPCSCLH